jgi:serine/threonine-protein kinase
MTSIAHDSTSAAEMGKYHRIAELARGGMGNVYLAVAHGPAGFSKLFAVKELKPELVEDEAFVAMFLDEARLAARLTHPNIVQTNEVGSEGNRPFMVMEFLDGRSLLHLRRRLGKKLTVGAQLRILAEALLGLHYAHELCDFDGEPLGIVHRDISPLNVFVTFDGQTKVLDFGIAKMVGSSQETKTGILKGRIAYMAPEQASGMKIDRRADVYAAGVMLWEAAAGRRLWPGMSEVQILSHALRDGPPPLHAVRPDAPVDLAAICARAMAREREARYATAADLFEDLEAHLAKRVDATSIREIGQLASKEFADERRGMAAIIEEAIAHARHASQSGVMPTFEAQLAGTRSSSRVACNDNSGSVATLLVRTPTSQHAVMCESAARPIHPRTAIAAPIVAEEEPRRRSPARRLLATVAAAALLALAVFIVAVLRAGAPVAQPVVAPAPSPAAPPPVREEPEVLDPVAPAPPLPAPVPSDTRRAGAPARGSSAPAHPAKHASAAQPTVTAIAPAPPAAPPSAPLPSPRPELDPAGGHAPLRPIVTSNPYGTP